MSKRTFSIRPHTKERIPIAQAEKSLRQTNPPLTSPQFTARFSSASMPEEKKAFVPSEKASANPKSARRASKEPADLARTQAKKESKPSLRKAAPDRRLLPHDISKDQKPPVIEESSLLEIPGFTNNARKARLARIQQANAAAAAKTGKGKAGRPESFHRDPTTRHPGSENQRGQEDFGKEALLDSTSFDWIMDQPWIQNLMQKARHAGTKKLAMGIVGAFALCLSISLGLSGCAQPFKLINQTFVMELGTDVYANPSLYIENADQADLGSLAIEPRSPGITISDNRFITVSLDYLGVGQYDFVLKDGDAEMPFVIKVKDTKPPTLKKSPDSIEIGWGQPVDWNDVFEATDLSGVYYEPSFDFVSTTGTHSVDVKIRDRFGNSTTKTITVTVTP